MAPLRRRQGHEHLVVQIDVEELPFPAHDADDLEALAGDGEGFAHGVVAGEEGGLDAGADDGDAAGEVAVAGLHEAAAGHRPVAHRRKVRHHTHDQHAPAR